MANTFTQIHLHIVFAVKYRAALIDRSWKDLLLQYITGIVQNHQHKMICINCMADHLHMLIGLRPDQSLSDLMRMVKADSSKWVNGRRFTPLPFGWQEGFGAFACSKQHLPEVIKYIQQQESHHAKKQFKTEYTQLLMEQEISFDERYIFSDPA